METVQQNDKSRNIPAMTEKINKFYIALAGFERHNKKDTETYRDILSLLLSSIQYEEKEIHNSRFSNLDEATIMSWYQSRKNMADLFHLFKLDMLNKIRFFNHSNSEYVCAINGIIKENMKQNLQIRIEENFMIEICKYLAHEELTEDERVYLIYYKYQMLATSKILEEKWISKELMVPYTNNGMTAEELYESDKHILPQVKSISKYLSLLHDSNITGHTILCVLYVKSCMSMLSPSTYETIVGAIRKCIKLNEDTMDTDLEKMCNLLSYIIEPPSYQKNMQ